MKSHVEMEKLKAQKHVMMIILLIVMVAQVLAQLKLDGHVQEAPPDALLLLPAETVNLMLEKLVMMETVIL